MPSLAAISKALPPVAVLVAALASTGSVQAQVHKCTDARGRTEYRSTPCADSTPPALALPAVSPGKADPSLAGQCVAWQDQVQTAEQRIARRGQEARALTATQPPALNEQEIREAALNTRQDRLRIQEWQRLAHGAGCGRIGVMPGTPPAEAAALAARCRRLRDGMQDWLDRHGAQSPERAEVLAHMRAEQREAGCKEP